MVAARPQGAANRRARRPIVDAEVHCLVEGEQTLVPYLPQRWRRHLELFGARIPTGGGPAVPSARAEGGRPDGAVSELARLREELLEGRGVELGVLIPLSGAGRSNNLELDAALARAVNDWQIAEWLEA